MLLLQNHLLLQLLGVLVFLGSLSLPSFLLALLVAENEVFLLLSFLQHSWFFLLVPCWRYSRKGAFWSPSASSDYFSEHLVGYMAVLLAHLLFLLLDQQVLPVFSLLPSLLL